MSFPIIDAHLHAWDPAAATYDWLGPELSPINRAMVLDDVAPELRAAGVRYSVYVQSADTAEDTAYLRASAAVQPSILGIVGFAPLDDPRGVEATLDEWADDPLMVGVRNLTHLRPELDWLLRPDVRDSLRILEERGVPLDVVAVAPRHLEIIPILSERHPHLHIVLDHLAHPPIGLPVHRPWRERLAAAAENPRVFGKISGMYAAAGDRAARTTDDIRPVFDDAVDIFSTDRLIFGGDWPIAVLAGGFTRVWDGLQPLFDGLGAAEREAVLGRNAARFYGLRGRDGAGIA